MTVIIARCEYCQGIWQVTTDLDLPAALMEGVCKECQAESDVERPLTFEQPDKLPKDWLTV